MAEHKVNAPTILRKRIGSTTYLVTVYSNPANKENLKEKITRLMKNNLHFQPKNDIIDLLQAGQPPERGSQ